MKRELIIDSETSGTSIQHNKPFKDNKPLQVLYIWGWPDRIGEIEGREVIQETLNITKDISQGF